jgi:cold shock protein
MKGTVKWFDTAKGFGFIQTETGKDVFVHYTGIAKKGFRGLEQGQAVEFEVTDGKKGPQAVAVTVVNE